MGGGFPINVGRGQGIVGAQALTPIDGLQFASFVHAEDVGDSAGVDAEDFVAAL